MNKKIKGFRLAAGIILIITVVFNLACSSTAGTDRGKKGFSVLTQESIDTNNIMDIIKELSSEKYEGRLAGTKGNELAAQYIAEYFKKIGIENPSGLEEYKYFYKQRVVVTNSEPVLQLVDAQNNVFKKYKYIDNFTTRASKGVKLKGAITGETLIINDVSELNSSNTSLENKIALVSMNIWGPSGITSNIISSITHCGAKGMIYEIDFNNPSYPYKHLVVAPNAPQDMLSSSEDGPVVLRADSNTFKEIADSGAKGNYVQITLDNSLEDVRVPNIVGLIPGTDKTMKDEYVIISAHFDHVGDNKNGTYNPGALDNGSGTAVLMEVARYLKESKVQPKKNILFIIFNGEEEGLYGAQDYANNPLYPLDKCIMINLDMVGSKTHMPLSICTLSGNETVLSRELSNYSSDLNIPSEIIKEDASDHAPFAARGIDAVTLINLDITNPGYHTFLDTVDRTIDSSRIKEVAKLVLYYLDKEAFNKN